MYGKKLWLANLAAGAVRDVQECRADEKVAAVDGGGIRGDAGTPYISFYCLLIFLCNCGYRCESRFPPSFASGFTTSIAGRLEVCISPLESDRFHVEAVYPRS